MSLWAGLHFKHLVLLALLYIYIVVFSLKLFPCFRKGVLIMTQQRLISFILMCFRLVSFWCFLPDKSFIVLPNCLPHSTYTLLKAAAMVPPDKSIKN